MGKDLFTEFRMDAGAVLPKHAHIHEQTGYLTEGKIRLTIGEQYLKLIRAIVGVSRVMWIIPPRY